MKNFFLIIFIISQLFSSTQINISNQITHTHEHTHFEGIEHIDEHSHVEVSTTLSYNLKDSKELAPLTKTPFLKEIKLPKNFITNSIFRPPIL